MSRVKISILIIGIFGIIIGVVGIGDTIKIMKKDFKSVDTAAIGDLETGDLAKGNICWAYDKIAVHKTTRSYGFIPMGSSEVPYYVVEVNDHFAVISAGNKDVQKQIERVATETDLYDSGDLEKEPTPVEVTTKVIEMPDKVREYLKEYCKNSGFDDATYAKLVDDSCVLNCVEYDSMKLIPFIGIGVGVLFIAIFVVLVIKGRNRY